MKDTATAEPTEQTAAPVGDPASDLADDLLVEEVSIDGMCGVY
jgi:mycofactocin precursor